MATAFQTCEVFYDKLREDGVIPEEMTIEVLVKNISDLTTELGCPGHFIGARRCHWRRHTQVGTEYRVSTIGNMHLSDSDERQEIGFGRFFETMVFPTNGNTGAESEGCGCLEVREYVEQDSAGYQTAGEAQRGHEEMVARFVAKVLKSRAVR